MIPAVSVMKAANTAPENPSQSVRFPSFAMLMAKATHSGRVKKERKAPAKNASITAVARVDSLGPIQPTCLAPFRLSRGVGRARGARQARLLGPAAVAPALRCKDRVSTVLVIPRKASPPVRPAVAVARAPIARGVVPASNAPALADAGHQLTTVHRGSFCSDGSPGLGARPPTLGTSGA